MWVRKSVLGLLLFFGSISLAWGAWEISLQTGKPEKPWPWADCWPVGRLSQDRLGIELIVLEGASGESLAFGPGRLESSDILGGESHAVLAGHRDTSFSFLKELLPGDELKVETYNTTKVYVVSETRIIAASMLYLDPQANKTLSLITCYPFDSVLPQTAERYLVTASAGS
jgi:sortase A